MFATKQIYEYDGCMPEGYVHEEHRDPGPLSEEESATIAEMISALANPPRVALLYALRRGGELPVGELAESVGVTVSAASQQLRILRHLGFVVARKEGRSVLYSLHDDHVASLLDEVRDHAEHARFGWTNSHRPNEIGKGISR